MKEKNEQKKDSPDENATTKCFSTEGKNRKKGVIEERREVKKEKNEKGKGSRGNKSSKVQPTYFRGVLRIFIWRGPSLSACLVIW